MSVAMSPGVDGKKTAAGVDLDKLPKSVLNDDLTLRSVVILERISENSFECERTEDTRHMSIVKDSMMIDGIQSRISCYCECDSGRYLIPSSLYIVSISKL
jgi:hypothetical protein